MRYDELERSNYDGVPSFLYEFSIGSKTWYYTAAQDDIVLNDVVYEAVGIQHEEYTQSGEPTDDDLTINISNKSDIPLLFIGTPPSTPILVKVRSVHRGDEQAPVVWSGSIRACKQVSQVEYQFTCNSLNATLNRNGLRLSWGRGCPHSLYDRQCKVKELNYEIVAHISAMTGNSLTLDGIENLPEGYLSGGYLKFNSVHDTEDYRGIEDHIGGEITLLGTSDGMEVGDWIKVYPGCDRTTDTCENKFNNLANFGGFPHLPTKSPFDGDPVF